MFDLLFLILPVARFSMMREGSMPLRILQLLEPVEAHGLDDPAVDHDEARFRARIGVEVLMAAIGRNIEEITLLPVVALGLRLPLEFHRVVDVEFDVPMQVVALALDHIYDLLGKVAMFAGGL